LPGDTIILSKGIDEVNDGTVYVEGINESSNSAVFKSRLKVQEKRIISI
jgi:phage repressor protein C with HTH and peptisase S24 domain